MVWSFINWYPDAQLQERHWLAGSSLQKCSHPPLLTEQLVYLTSTEKMNSKRDMSSWKAKESQEGKAAKWHHDSSEQQLTMDLGWQLWVLMALGLWDSKQTLVQNNASGEMEKTQITVRAGRLENRKFICTECKSDSAKYWWYIAYILIPKYAIQLLSKEEIVTVMTIKYLQWIVFSYIVKNPTIIPVLIVLK